MPAPNRVDHNVDARAIGLHTQGVSGQVFLQFCLLLELLLLLFQSGDLELVLCFLDASFRDLPWCESEH